MLDREVVREFLDGELKEMKIPDDIFKETLVATFCKYVKDDYYEWLKDNFKSFFNYGKPDWKWIREKIKKHGERHKGSGNDVNTRLFCCFASNDMQVFIYKYLIIKIFILDS